MRRKPRIAVDLDGVVYDWQGAYTYLVNQHLGKCLDTGLEWWTDWYAVDQYLDSDEQEWVWTRGVELGLFRYGHHLKGSIDGLRELATVGDLEVVTHRPATVLQESLRFIANLPDVFSGVHFLTSEEPKSSVGCDVYVDDAPHVVKDVLDCGRSAVIFDQPWNRYMPYDQINELIDPPLLLRAYGWSEVPDKVREALGVL